MERTAARDYFRKLQNQITEAIDKVNEKKFHQDVWIRDGGGGGETRVYSDGELLEKGGVNFSEVFGELSSEFALSMPIGDGTNFYATGISLVLHPINPFVPTVHANFRYVQRGSAAWFGGGADLTPYYFYLEDAVHFHKTYYEALKPYGEKLYREFKAKCDEYFYLPHRKETRGVGGIFYDYKLADGLSFDWMRACGDNFLKSYLPIVERRVNTEFSDEQKLFQEIRRGRYVEFNLLYDRGTTFGLKTNGRTESILMSLPPRARWVYDYKPEPHTREADLYMHLCATNWLNLA